MCCVDIFVMLVLLSPCLSEVVKTHFAVFGKDAEDAELE